MPDRIATLRQCLRQLQLDALLVSDPASLRYLFGFTGSNGMALVTDRRVLFVTDWRYREQVREEVKNAEILIAVRDPLALLKEKKVLSDRARLGVEEYHLTYRQATLLRKHYPTVSFHLTEQAVAILAMQKTPEEIAVLRQAARMASAVWDQVLPCLRAGVSESEVAAEIVYRARKAGSQTEAFEPIVASGPRSALPHARSSRRRLTHGDLVVVDFGCVVEGYCADFTRTVAVGEPSPELRRMHRIVKEAGDLAYAAVRGDMPAKELDKVAREHFERHGLGDRFNHSLGHGIGIDIHSLPRIGPESNDTVVAGAVVAIEPGAYLPGVGGVRLEDDVLVLAQGCEVLTTASRELPVVE